VALFHNILVKMVEIMPQKMVWIFSRKYIAGESLASAIQLVKELNSKGILATMDVLGESIKTKDEAIQAKNSAMQVLEIIDQEKLNANLSIKPTQMGLAIDPELAYELVKELVKKAKEINNFVRIDMEDSPYTDVTINLYKKIYEEFDNVGIVLQAYLKRTYNDAIVLNKIGTNYRLCKGIYIEPGTIAYKEKNAIRENYLKTLEIMLKNGNYVGIATHDKPLIDGAYKMINELNIPKKKFEFQMLLGVREDIRDKINADGYKIRIYVPFGKDWYKYSIRRLKENPNMAGHIVKEFFAFRR
jgi:proline dehydrogenase